jgi:hypothetical protein
VETRFHALFSGGVPPWKYYFTVPFFALERGWVYRYLGRSDPGEAGDRGGAPVGVAGGGGDEDVEPVAVGGEVEAVAAVPVEEVGEGAQGVGLRPQPRCRRGAGAVGVGGVGGVGGGRLDGVGGYAGAVAHGISPGGEEVSGRRHQLDDLRFGFEQFSRVDDRGDRLAQNCFGG